MVRHEAKGVHLPVGLLAGFPKGGQKTLAIMVVLVDGLPAITTIHDVIHRTGVLDAQLARHTGRLLQEAQARQEDFRPRALGPAASCFHSGQIGGV